MTTHYGTARLAGVSIATKARAPRDVDQAPDAAGAHAHAHAAAEELGHAPCRTVRDPGRQREEVIGIVRVQRPASPPWNMSSDSDDKSLDGVIGHVRDIGWSLLVTYWDGVTATDARRLDTMSGMVDGILVSGGSLPSLLLDRLAARAPVVMIGGPGDTLGYDVVAADIRSGAAAVVTHLVCEHGSRRLLHLSGPAGAPGTSQWRAALEQALHSHPGSRLVGTLHVPASVEGGEQAAERVLSTADGLPDAIVCASDEMAVGLLRKLDRAGVRVPGDVAVAGFGDTLASWVDDPSLTTTRQPMRALGKRACARLIERIAVPGLPPSVELLPTDLVVRSSCGCLPGPPARAR